MLTRRVVLLGIAATATTPRIAKAQNVVRVGMVMPLTGTLADAGRQVVAGARLYMDRHGDSAAGMRIELLVRDDTSSFDVGKRLIQEAIVNDKVNIIAGGTTGDLFAGAPIITEAKVPTVIMLSSTSAAIDRSPYFVRTMHIGAVVGDHRRLGDEKWRQKSRDADERLCPWSRGGGNV
jgi:branched-chain amino acid transport system substrate-binding protein